MGLRRRWGLLVILFVFSLAPALAQPPVHSANTFSLNADSGLLAFRDAFGSRLDEVGIVGIGEVAHGGHEPFEFKRQMLSYLITEQGFRTLIDEVPDIYYRNMDRYLQDNTPLRASKIDSLFTEYHQQIGIAFDVSEIRNTVSWLKSYNLTHPNDRISLRGMDIFTGFDDIRKTYFSDADWMKVKTRLGPGKKIGRDEAQHIIDEWYNGHQDSLKRNLSPERYEQLLIDLRDFSTWVRYEKYGSEKNQSMITLRDSIMASNCFRLIRGKTVVLAHNLHIANTGLHINLFRSKLLGNFLRERYGKSYFILLSDFSGKAELNIVNGNEFRLRNYRPDKASAAFILKNRFNIRSGIIFENDLEKANLGYGFDAIGLEGDQNFTPGRKDGFDAIVIFQSMTPSRVR